MTSSVKGRELEAELPASVRETYGVHAVRTGLVELRCNGCRRIYTLLRPAPGSSLGAHYVAALREHAVQHALKKRFQGRP